MDVGDYTGMTGIPTNLFVHQVDAYGGYFSIVTGNGSGLTNLPEVGSSYQASSALNNTFAGATISDQGNKTVVISAPTTLVTQLGYSNSTGTSETVTTSSTNTQVINIALTFNSVSAFVVPINVSGDAILTGGGLTNVLDNGTYVSNVISGQGLYIAFRLPNYLYGKAYSITSAYAWIYGANSGSTTLLSLVYNNDAIDNNYTTVGNILGTQSVASSIGAFGPGKFTFIDNAIQLIPEYPYLFQVTEYWTGSDTNTRISEITVFLKTN